MQGSIAITSNPVIMENSLVFRQKLLGLSLTASVPQRQTGINKTTSKVTTTSTASRCLFGPPDPQESKALVQQVELKNALNFENRFNFNIVSGQPFQSTKSNSPNVENENDGYIWTLSFQFAPALNSNPSSDTFPSQISATSHHESPVPTDPEISEHSSIPSPQGKDVTSPETNNNVLSHSILLEKKPQQNSTVHYQFRHHPHHLRSSPKKSSQSSHSTAHHILSKYNTRLVKQNLMKKSRKSIITDYLHVNRIKSSHNMRGKKQEKLRVL